MLTRLDVPTAPAFVISAPKSGTGKSLLAFPRSSALTPSPRCIKATTDPEGADGAHRGRSTGCLLRQCDAEHRLRATRGQADARAGKTACSVRAQCTQDARTSPSF